MSLSTNDTDGIFFASLVDYLGTYPQSSLGSVMAYLKADSCETGGSGVAAGLSRVAVSGGGDGESHHKGKDWPLEREEGTLVGAWRAALTGPAQSSSLAELVRRTESFFCEVAAHMAKQAPRQVPSMQQATTSAVRVLTPLLDHLRRPSAADAGPPSLASSPPSPAATLRAAERAAYGRLAPVALRIVVQETLGMTALPAENSIAETEKTEQSASLYAWLWRQAMGTFTPSVHTLQEAPQPPQLQRRCDAAIELLAPYVTAAVEPFEKELRFHFQPGKDTAKGNEPQHFFGFLEELLITYQHDAHMMTTGEGTCATTTNAAAAAADGSISLCVLGQVALCMTAASIFQETYQWSPTSPLLTSATFVVHTLNSFFDFVSANEAHVCHEALLLLSRHIAFNKAVDIFLSAAATTATEAFASAPGVLWRRAALQEGDSAEEKFLSVPGAGAFFMRTVHFARCLEALVRRLSATLLTADPLAWRSVVWGRLVAGALGDFLDAAEQALMAEAEYDEEGDPAVGGVGVWVALCRRFELIESVHLVSAAAEDWLGLLLGDGLPSTAVRHTAEALDELILLRDRIARAAADSVQRQVAVVAAAGGLALAEAAWGLETFLNYMENGPAAAASSSTKFILETVLRKAVTERFTAEQRTAVHGYFALHGLKLAGELFF